MITKVEGSSKRNAWMSSYSNRADPIQKDLTLEQKEQERFRNQWRVS